MDKLPEGATFRSVGNATPVRMMETTKGTKIALVEVSDYAKGEAMGAIAKRTGVRIVLLCNDGDAASMTVAEVEALMSALHIKE